MYAWKKNSPKMWNQNFLRGEQTILDGWLQLIERQLESDSYPMSRDNQKIGAVLG